MPLSKGQILAVQSDGRGTPDLAGLWDRLSERGREIATHRARGGCWAAGESDGALGNNLGGIEVATLVLSTEAPAREGVRVIVKVTRTDGSAAFSVSDFSGTLFNRSQFSEWRPVGDPNATPSDTLSASGAYYVDLPAPRASFGLIRVEASGLGKGGSLDMQVDFVGAYLLQAGESREGLTVPSTWPVLAHAHAGGADLPDDVATLRRLVDQSNHAWCRPPRVLALHVFGGPMQVTTSGTAADLDERELYLPRGADTGSLTLHAYVDAAAGGLVVGLDVWDGAAWQLAGEATPDGVTGWQTANLDQSVWTADTMHRCRLRIERADAGGGDFGGGGELLGFSIVENERDGADYLAGGDSMPSGPAFGTHATGAPIVASYAAGSSLQRGDRLTVAEDVAWLAWRASQALAFDWLDTSTARTGRSGSYVIATGSIIARGRHVVGHLVKAQGAGSLSVYAYIDAPVARLNMQWRVGVFASDGVSEAAAEAGGARPVVGWREVGRIPLDAFDAEDVLDVAVVTGWADGGGLPAASDGATVGIRGLAIFEAP